MVSVTHFIFLSLLAAFVNSAEVSEVMNDFVLIPAGELTSVVPVEEGNNVAIIDDFFLQASPVTNAEFLRFLLYHPEWQRGNAVSLFVDDQYLSNWSSPIALGADTKPNQPVIQVSWFAANAYCESLNARLPHWYEWEYVSAANENIPDARQDPAWRQQILSWYSQAGGAEFEDVRTGSANYYGIFDTHGLVWEWIDDYNSLLVSGDNREQGGADELLFCGAGAITMEQKENFAVLMRIAMLSSLEARYTTRNLGFRCARSVGGEL